MQPFFYGWVLLQLALYLSVAVLWRRGWGSPAQRLQLLLDTRRVAVVAASVPVSTFLANLLPWWRFPVPMVSVVACVGLFTTAISAMALLGPWRRRLFGPLAVLCATTMSVLTLDVMTGSRLQLSSLMGLQPVIGGRFFGMGNVTFALFATATLMLCLAVGNHFISIGQPRYAAAAVGTIGMAAVIVDASPSWGSDLGGPTALLPAVILLILAILRIRLTWRVVVGPRGWGRRLHGPAEHAGLAWSPCDPFPARQIRADHPRRWRLGHPRPQARAEHRASVEQPQCRCSSR